MRKSLSYLTALVLLISISGPAQPKPAAKPPVKLAAPGPTVAITDPSQITSKDKWDVQALSIEKLYMTREIGDSAWSPDGKQIAFISNISGRDNLWVVPSEGGWPVQLTVSNQRQQSPAWSPTGRWIAYVSDTDGT